LRQDRNIEIACWKDGKLFRASEAEAALRKFGAKGGFHGPAIAFGGGNQLRLLYRRPMNANWLAVWTTAWSESGWTKPEMLLNSEGRIDQRIVTAQAGPKFVAVYPAGSAHNTIYARTFDTTQTDLAPALTAAGPLTAKSAPFPPARHTLNSYQLVFGDLH